MKRAYSTSEKLLFAAPLLFIALGIGAWVWRRNTPINVNVSNMTDISALSFSPDGKKLAVSFRDEMHRRVPVQVFDLESRSKLWEIKPPSAFMDEVAWSPDGQRLVGGYTLYDSGPVKIGNPPRVDKKPTGFRFNNIGKYAIWEANSGDLIGEFPYAPIEEDSQVKSIRFSADGKTLIGEGQPSALFDATTGQRLRVYSRNPLARVNSKLGLLAQIGGKDRRVQVIDLKTGSKIWQSNQTGYGQTPLEVTSWQGSILSIVYESPNNGLTPNFNWSLWAAKTRSLLPSPPTINITMPQANLDGKTFAFINRQHLPPTPASRGEDKWDIVVWDCQLNKVLWRQPCDNYLYNFCWSPDGKWLSYVEESPTDSLLRLKVYDSQGQLHIERVVSGYLAVWSPDSRRIAVASYRRDTNRQIELVKVGE